MVTMSSVDPAAAGGQPHPSQPPNLTRDQATARSAQLEVTAYRIDLDPADGQGRPGEKTSRTHPVINFKAGPGSATCVDFVGDGIRTATLNGSPLDVAGWTNGG